MNASEINQTFDLVSYVGSVVKLTKKKNYFAGPCPMCGGRDRFTIKRTGGDIWHCRKCSPDGYHSPIDFFMKYHNLDFKQALEKMGGNLERPQAVPTRVIHPAPIQVAPDQDWQKEAWKHTDAASDILLESIDGAPGRRYLLSRGISRGSMYMWLLGYGVVYGRPAIFIPYLDLGNVITAVKYRFIDERARKDKGARFAMIGGSLPYLFGLQHTLESSETLLFVEGELNAISVSQALPRGVSVVSAGSESNGHAVLLRALGTRYNNVVVWMDDPIKAVMIRSRMGRDARLIQSPMIDGKKWDANEMLKNGLLMDFLSRQFSTECLGIPDVLPTPRSLPIASNA